MLKYRVAYTVDGREQSVHFVRLENVNDFIATFPEGAECAVYEQNETKLKTIRVTEVWKGNWEKTKTELLKQHELKGATNDNSKQIEVKG